MRIIPDTSESVDQPIMTTFHHDEEQRIDFPFGLPGFESSRYFILSRLKDHELFNMLKSEDDARISLLIMNARYLKSQKCITISQSDLESVGAANQNELSIFVILKIDHESGLFTANLRAPLIVNSASNKGRQVILDDKNLSVTHPLIPLASQE